MEYNDQIRKLPSKVKFQLINPMKAFQTIRELPAAAYSVSIKNRTFIIVNSPELAQEILIKKYEKFPKPFSAVQFGMSGEMDIKNKEWRNGAHVLSNFFRNPSNYSSVIVRHVNNLVDRWARSLAQDIQIDIPESISGHYLNHCGYHV